MVRGSSLGRGLRFCQGCDRNRFAGDLTALAALAELKPPSPQPPGQPTPQPPAPSGTPWPGVYFVWPNKISTAREPVRQWQTRLSQLGFQIRVDGLYGPASKTACMSLQRDHGLNVDGIVGPRTREAVFATT